MIRKHSGLRAALATLAAGLACSGCSVWVSAGTSPPTAAPAPSPTLAAARASGGSHPHRSSSGSSLPPLQASPPADSDPGAPTYSTTAGRSFIAGVNAYCRDLAVARGASIQRYPLRTPTENHERAALLETDVQKLLPHLTSLSPPPAQAHVFGQFVANEQALKTDYARGASTASGFGVLPGQFMAEDQPRFAYGVQLGASGCDGSLPPAQWEAAAKAVQRFDLATEPRQACVSLVTPSFVRETWGYTRNPMAACRLALRAHRGVAASIPDNIAVKYIIGVANAEATVFFEELPDCGCEPSLSATLYLEHGRWLVDSMTAH